MGAIPGDLDTERQPPMTVPLRHFVVGLGFLLAGAVLGALATAGDLPGSPALVHVHLLLAGWVCITIMGAMTQFVPVWSGTTLYSRRLAGAQLGLVAVGFGGFAVALLGGPRAWLPVAGGLALVGFWTFGYNIGRTLLPTRPWDVTERHFALALAFFAVVPVFGVLLAIGLGYQESVFAGVPVTRSGVRAAHATLAVFGAVLTTILGALYQLVPMFTQSPDHAVDRPLRGVESVAYPTGVVALATARLLGLPAVGRAGGALLVLGLLAFCALLVRRLATATVPWTPMLRRYVVVAGSMALWAALTLPAWLAAPLAPGALLGGPGLGHVLAFGVVGFVVLGTLYHIVPFIVWVHEYSDDLGLGAVPMIDDLYDDRFALADLAALVVGASLVVAGDLQGLAWASAVGGTLVVLGVAVFTANLLLVVWRHSPHSVVGLLLPGLARRDAGEETPAD